MYIEVDMCKLIQASLCISFTRRASHISLFLAQCQYLNGTLYVPHQARLNFFTPMLIKTLPLMYVHVHTHSGMQEHEFSRSLEHVFLVASVRQTYLICEISDFVLRSVSKLVKLLKGPEWCDLYLDDEVNNKCRLVTPLQG